MKYTIKQFRAEYPDDAACLAAVMRMRHGGTEIKCPGCKKPSKFSPMTKRRAYACQWCGHHVYPCVGTPFEKSRRPLTDWFTCMYFLTSTRHGVAAKEIQRQIGMTYKCAWRMCHELRKLMAASGPSGPLGGHVEIDESYIGPKGRKATVLAMAERGGPILAAPIPDTKMTTLDPIVRTWVEPGAIVTTDSHPSYGDLTRSGYRHVALNHSAKEYFRGEHQTGHVDGFWSHLKRGIRGTHIHVSTKHLWKYVSEFSYRFTYRHASHASTFYALMHGLSQPHAKGP